MMTQQQHSNLIPANTSGRAITAEASRSFESDAEASAFFSIVLKRMAHVNQWQQLAGAAGAAFQLFSKTGEPLQRSVEQGNFIRINIPGPGSKAGEGFDWVVVQELQHQSFANEESFGFTVQPAADPQTANTHVAHFFSKKSSSTFLATRKGNNIIAGIYDRNIEANDETEEKIDKLRNAIVGITAKHGFSKLQWQALVDGFLQN